MHTYLMEQDWKRLAGAIRQAREAAGMTQIDLAGRADIASGSVQNLESGRERSRIPQSLAKVEQALGWEPGSGVAILRGTVSRPRRIGEEPAEDPPRSPSGLPLRVIDELEDGPLLDSTVLDLGDDSGARMIVVVRGKPGASPEEIHEALQAWRRMERRMQQPPESE
jgi:transcriptional regulator with XRE-family HTH domain